MYWAPDYGHLAEWLHEANRLIENFIKVAATNLLCQSCSSGYWWGSLCGA